MIRTIFEKFKRERDLTSIGVGKGVLLLGLPMIAGNLLQATYNLVDMIWVGRLGADALAAVSMAGSVLMVTMFIMAGVGIGTTALIARAFGAKQIAQAETIAIQSILMGLIGSVVFGLIGYHYSSPMLQAMGAHGTVLTLANGFMQITFAGIIVMFCLFFVSAILQGAGDAVTPMIVLGFTVLLNVVIDPFLIFGFGPIPRMGVNGAAWATLISQAVGSLWALEIMFSGRSRLHLKRIDLKVDFSCMWRILKVGIPASAQMILRGVMGVVLISVVAGFGTAAIAAYGVGMRLMMLAMMPGFALGGAAATMVGQNIGAKLHQRAEASAWAAVRYYAIFMLGITGLFMFLAPQLMSIFNSEPEVVAVGSHFLQIISWGMLLVAVGLILGRAVAGAGDTMAPMIFTFIALWLVQIPLAIFLAKTSLGLAGIWWSVLASQIVLVVLNTVYFQLGYWKTKRV